MNSMRQWQGGANSWEKKTRHATIVALILLLFVFTACSRCDSVSRASVQSKSGQYLALVSGSTCGPLLSELDSFVEVQHPHYVGRHKVWTTKKTIAGGKLSPNELTLNWVDDNHLSVNCSCRRNALDFSINEWSGIKISYVFSP